MAPQGSQSPRRLWRCSSRCTYHPARSRPGVRSRLSRTDRLHERTEHQEGQDGAPTAKRSSRHDFPTPESPMSSSCVAPHTSACVRTGKAQKTRRKVTARAGSP